MNNAQKQGVFIAIAVIIIVVTALFISFKPTPQSPHAENNPEKVEVLKEKPSCMDEDELKTFFQIRIDEEAAWQKVYYRFYFTAKRMAAEPWIEHQRIMDLESHGGSEGIQAYNKSDGCDVETLKAQMSIWDQWHNVRMLSLQFIKDSYPKIKEAE